MVYRFPTLITEHPSEIHICPMQPISLLVEADGKAGPPLPSMIHSFTEGESIVVGVAPRDDAEITAGPGTRVRLQATQPDGIRTYFTRVLRRHAAPFPSLVLAWPDGVIRLNRRDSVRIATAVRVDVTYRLPQSASPCIVRTTTVDLSEGGMTLIVPTPIPEGTVLSVRLHLPNTPEIHVCGGRVVRSSTGHLPASEERSWVGVEFGSLSATIQRSLRLYLWAVQREMLRGAARD